MKKLVFLAIIAISVVACTQSGENGVTTADPHQFGFNYDSTAQMDVIKGTFKDIETYDTMSYASKYVDTVKFHDNGRLTNLNENVEILKQFKEKGITLKVKDGYPMWSSHFNFKDGNQGDYVYSYLTTTFTKGEKSIDVVMFQADLFNKDGKIEEEWLVYDLTGIAELMK